VALEQNINAIRGALLDGKRGRNVRKIFLLCKMKKLLSCDRTLLKVAHLIATVPSRSCSLE
jgi:hypothetical protein